MRSIATVTAASEQRIIAPSVSSVIRSADLYQSRSNHTFLACLRLPTQLAPRIEKRRKVQVQCRKGCCASRSQVKRIGA